MADDEFVVYAVGLCFASVCTSLSSEEAAARMFPSGTRNGWQVSDEDFRDGAPNGVPCNEKPDTHRHVLLEC